MRAASRRFLLLAAVALSLFAAGACAETAADHAVQLSARVSLTPRSIKLLWLRGADAVGYAVARKGVAASNWTALASLPRTATQFTDTSVAAGVGYEYRVIKVGPNYKGYGFISAGIGVPLVENRGQIILLVESSQAAPLALELARLESDLIGDGWTVLRHDVDRQAGVASVKQIVMTDYTAAPTKVKALFIFGHVPVPYSGNFAPDEHGEHVGAWPADGYYGTATGDWTDASVNNSRANDVRNRNTPGDGKFDQNTLPASLVLQIGRVDLSNLPAFADNETELLRRYLNKNHTYRHRVFASEAAGLITDEFGAFGGEAFAAGAWSNFAALLGPSKVKTERFFPTVIDNSRLLAYACGGGSYTNVGDAARTANFAGQRSLAVFTAFFGSFFGDWDSPDNLMRSALASTGLGLSAMWAGRPCWYLHPLGQGQTLGYCARLSQNNSTVFPPGRFPRGIHTALLGDPTLRLHVIPPPSQLQATTSGSAVQLTWQAPATAVFGYHVYRAPSPSGPFTRLNTGAVRSTSFTDSAPASGTTYQVRAIRQQGSNSGTYWNASQGVFVQAP